MDHKSIETILTKALDNATNKSHEYMTIEHITIELLKSKTIAKRSPIVSYLPSRVIIKAR